MDPFSAVAIVITVSTFIKDVIELGQKIKASVDKVLHSNIDKWGTDTETAQISQNKKRIRELLQEVVQALEGMEELYEGKEEVYEKADDVRRALFQLKL
jgi:t-SNARE complex subunit (syntaxin)